MDSFIFGYGTLIPKHYRENKIVAEIKGFKRIFHPGDDYGLWYPFVITKADATCRGLLIRDPDGTILTATDTYEGYPELYDRVEVPAFVIQSAGSQPGDAQLPTKAWLYVPSTKTCSLTLDRIFKQMKKHDKIAYKEMMEKDLWLEKMRQEYPHIVESLPALFT
nr:gamma-glutamylcyclotransferase family protein [Candidatus Sigynarchaeum springense]MDO8117829.1 gamma-glutamylcyclotransferase family protein [Candidatus Sigynarchaeota archaeon]